MKNILLVIAFVIVAGGGYIIGAKSGNDADTEKKLQDSIVMMNEQSADIQKMAEMMNSNGVVMQEAGVKYKDDGMVSKGKDLEAMGVKYMMKDKSSTDGGSMGEMMGH